MILPLLLGLVSGQEPVRPHLDASLEAARWLDRVAVEAPGGVAWPADPARSGEPGWTLYGGTPGVVLFHLELHAATGEGRWLVRAQQGADALAAWTRSAGPDAQVGLYTGLGGVAFALMETGLASGEERHLVAARAILDRLGSQAEGDPRSLTPVTDVIAGDAGVGFLLLDTARRLERPQDLELAAAIGRSLITRADGTEHGLDWAMSPGYARRMPNFSHGAAGVATFLAALSEATGEQAFLDAALRGAAHVEASARREDGFRLHHHVPEGEELFYLGWCHGPPGTARLFRTLARVTGERRWTGLAAACAGSLHAAGLPDGRPDGYWNNVGTCCGAAGVAGFLLDQHRRAGGEQDLDLARALTADLLERGTRDDTGLRWEHAEHRVRPEYLSTQTGWMQGAAGIGHWLLTLDAFEQGRTVRIVLPDDR